MTKAMTEKLEQNGRQGNRNWEQLNPRAAEAAEFYARHYTVVFQASLNAKRRTILEDPATDGVRRCRFCGRSRPEVSFRKEAHAVPEFLGNKSIFTRNECDECNQKLAQTVEDHLAKSFGPIRTITHMRGKRGVPTYKAIDGSARIAMKSTGLEFHLNKDKPDFKEGQPADLALSMLTEPFVPVAAAKCLVKIACCLAPPEDLPHLEQTISWVTFENHAACPLRIEPLPVLCSFRPGPNPYGNGRVFLLRRRTDERRVPYLVLAVATANHVLAAFAPFCGQDDFSQGKFQLTLCYFPVLFPEETRFGRTSYYRFDWSSAEPRRDDREFTMHIENLKKITPHVPS